jgi:hypothetical protein
MPPTWRVLLGAYLKAVGFEETGAVYRHSSGDTVRLKDGIMHAARYDSAGQLTGQYWVAESSLEEGVDIPAGVWHAMRLAAEVSFLLTPAGDGNISCYRTADLMGMVEEFPSRYRLHRRVQ